MVGPGRGGGVGRALYAFNRVVLPFGGNRPATITEGGEEHDQYQAHHNDHDPAGRPSRERGQGPLCDGHRDIRIRLS